MFTRGPQLGTQLSDLSTQIRNNILAIARLDAHFTRFK